MTEYPNRISPIHQNISALYGTFNMNMLPLITVDVTNKLLAYIKGNILDIPQHTNFNDLFGNVASGRKYLQVKINGRVFNIAEGKYLHNVVIDFSQRNNRIKIVYYLYISNNSNWQGIISGQLSQLKGYGILSEADLYVHITNTCSDVDGVEELIKSITPSAIISTSTTNQFEYPGLKLVHDLATNDPDSDFLYFHSKGMSHGLHSRSWDELILFTKTFENWRSNLQMLGRDGIEKAGLFPAEEGWLWYNFWYATGKYLSQLAAPKVSDHRWYYEAWLGRSAPNAGIKTKDTINTYKVKNIKQVYFTPVEADYYMANLVYKRYATPEFKKVRFIVKSSFLIYHYLRIKFFFSFLKGKPKP